MKKYLPDPKTIPAILVLGAIGAVVITKALPAVFAWLAEKTPVLMQPKAA
jgi:hypothetical protein